MSKTYLEEYYDLIQRGEVVAGYWIKAELKNLIEDLKDPRYIYDTTQAHKRIEFQEHFCLQSKQPYYGKPLKLVPWQKAFWEVLYSFKMADTGLLRFTEALLEIARKNGKSTMFAGDAMYDLFLGAGGMDICCASNDDRQARLIWGEIAGMRERLDPKRALTKPTLTELRNRSRGITIFRLSSKTHNKDGFNISKTLMDESHDITEANGTSEVAEACWRGMSSKDEPLFLNASSQGFNRKCYLDKKIDYAKKVIKGEIDDIHFLAFLYEQDSESEIWSDEKTWEKSNPSLPYGIKKIAKMRRDLETAKYDKATRIHMLTKDFDLAQDSAQAWLMRADYDYKTDQIDLEKFRGSYLIGAVDLSATTDLTHARAMLLMPGSDKKYMIGRYFIPESKLEDSDDKAAGAKYAEWARADLLTINEGQEVDIAGVADWFLMLYKKYGIRPFMIGYDERYAKTFINRATDYGFELELLKQGRALSNAMKLTEADLKHRVINYGMNEIDMWCLKNTCCEVDGVGQIQPRKEPGQQSRRIDGALTMIMLEEVYRRYGTDFRKRCGVA